MARNIEHLLRLAADMKRFENPQSTQSDELSDFDLELIAAGTHTPDPDWPGDKEDTIDLKK